MAEPAVANASPIILLARAGHFELLRMFSNEIIVPTAVADEVHQGSDQDVAVDSVVRVPWVRIVPDPAIPPCIQAWDIGVGESAVLAWALAHRGCEAIIDDLAARRCAATIGVQFRGTLGIVLLAKQRGAVDKARVVIERLLQSGMYLSDDVIDRALALVGE